MVAVVIVSVRVREAGEGTVALAEIAEAHLLERVTGRADFLVDLEATLQFLAVEGSEDAFPGPVMGLGLVGLALGAVFGVDAAVILDGRIPHGMLLEIFTRRGAGTLVRR